MKKRFKALLLLGWLIPASMAWAESPVVVSHTLTGYTLGADTVTLNFTLNVKNTSVSSISNVILSYVPLTIGNAEELRLNVATLDAQAEVQIPFTVTTPMLLDQAIFTQLPLYWAGTCTDNNGTLMEFPANSVEGGVL